MESLEMLFYFSEVLCIKEIDFQSCGKEDSYEKLWCCLTQKVLWILDDLCIERNISSFYKGQLEEPKKDTHDLRMAN